MEVRMFGANQVSANYGMQHIERKLGFRGLCLKSFSLSYQLRCLGRLPLQSTVTSFDYKPHILKTSVLELEDQSGEVAIT
eukprot:scaffold4062_cov137-Cylindrotheca_fusiformis.AAC.10